MYSEMKKKKLKEITDISLGHSFRVKIEDNNDGNIFVIQAKDIKDNFVISDFDTLFKIKCQACSKKLLKKGDVLLSNRGYFSASIFDLEQETIGTSSLYILRPKKDIILPEYLAIWINSKNGQREINKNNTGSMIKTILKADLENLNINIPKLKQQKKIINLYKTQIELKYKINQKKDIIENIFQETLSKIITNKK